MNREDLIEVLKGNYTRRIDVIRQYCLEKGKDTELTEAFYNINMGTKPCSCRGYVYRCFSVFHERIEYPYFIMYRNTRSIINLLSQTV